MISICSFNTCGLKSNLSFIQELLSPHKLVFLIEHWLSSEEEHIVQALSSTHTVFDAEFNDLTRGNGRPYGGCCWLIDNDWTVIRHERFDRHLSSLEVKMGSEGMSIKFYGIWMPYDGGKAETLG